MRKEKLRFKVPSIVSEKIKEDMKHFDLSMRDIGNRLIAYYADKEVEKTGIKTGEDIIQFSPTKEIEERYETILKEHDVDTEAEFLRDIFFKYSNNPRYIREEILFEDIIIKIKNGILENKKLNIKYNKEIRTINPYMIKVSSGEDRTYLFCYCEKNKEYRNYRISNIEAVLPSKNEIEYIDLEYIKNIEENFDPFLSYGKKVVVKITKQGEKIYTKALLNRPKLIEKTGDIWTFQCDNKLAQIYFPQFLSNVEILEPQELKKWFREEFEKVIKKY